jgi:hypothetical protein
MAAGTAKLVQRGKQPRGERTLALPPAVPQGDLGVQVMAHCLQISFLGPARAVTRLTVPSIAAPFRPGPSSTPNARSGRGSWPAVLWPGLDDAALVQSPYLPRVEAEPGRKDLAGVLP